MSMHFRTIEEMLVATSEAIRPSERLTVSEAATKYRVLDNPGSYKGPWLNEKTPYLCEPMDVLTSKDFTGMIFVGPAQAGKALSLDTLIPTPSGWTTMGDLKAGDLVIGSGGQPTRVTFATDVMLGRECFEVVFANGQKVIADADHNWSVTRYRDDRGGSKIRTTKELIGSGRWNVPVAGVKRRPKRQSVTAIVSITPVDSVPVRCITVDSDDHLYAFGRSMTMTHNTDMLLNWITHSVVCDPSDTMVIQMSQSTARDFSKRRLDKLFRQSPEVGSRRAPGRQNQNVYDTTFTSGMFLTSSWPTINELSGKPIPRLWLTDYDRMPEDIDTNGSPFDLAQARTKTFKRFGMTVAESSPGRIIDDPRWKPKTRHEAPPTTGILSLYNRGDRRRFLWDCPQCQNKFEPDFNHMHWPENVSPIEQAEQACMMCPECNFPITEDMRYAMNLSARWIKDGETWCKNGRIIGEGERSDTASFWLMGPAAGLGEWRTMVSKYLSAKKELDETGSQEAMKTTVNTEQGKPYMLVGVNEIRLPENLKEHALITPRGVVPSWVRFLVGCIDIQKNRFVCQVHGVGVNGDMHVVDRFDIKTSLRTDESSEVAKGQFFWVSPGSYIEDWDLLIDGILTKKYPIEDGDGAVMALKAVACDSGGREGVTKNAYEFWRSLRRRCADGELDQTIWQRFQLIKGDPFPTAPKVAIRFPDAERKDRKAQARGEVPILFINSNQVKDQLDNMLNRQVGDDEGGRVTFCDGLADSFYLELTVEVRTIKGWENPKDARNESWDLLCYGIAVTYSRHCHIDKIDWKTPPGWAKDWKENDLVFVPDKSGDKRFAPAPVSKYDLSALGERLG